jgi:hypothetical protein
MSDEDRKNPNLIEVFKRNGDYSKNYGRWLGAVIYLLSVKAARPRSFAWKVPLAGLTLVGGILWKFGFILMG